MQVTYCFLSRSLLRVENKQTAPSNLGDLMFVVLHTDMPSVQGPLPFTALESGWSLQSGWTFVFLSGDIFFCYSFDNCLPKVFVPFSIILFMDSFILYIIYCCIGGCGSQKVICKNVFCLPIMDALGMKAGPVGKCHHQLLPSCQSDPSIFCYTSSNSDFIFHIIFQVLSSCFGKYSFILLMKVFFSLNITLSTWLFWSLSFTLEYSFGIYKTFGYMFKNKA